MYIDYSKPKSSNSENFCNEFNSKFEKELKRKSHRELAKDDIKESKEKDTDFKIPTPIEIKNHLDKTVIGQEQAKKSLATEVYKHFMRIKNESWLNQNNKRLTKSNILLTGNSGTGKTFLVQEIAKLLDIPLVIIDTTTLTPAGFKGEDIESIFAKLVNASDGNVNKAQNGIIFLDELDKIGRQGTKSENSKDSTSEGVQQGLLKILEGTVVRFGVCEIDTRDILFIGAGSFEGIEELVSTRLRKNDNVKQIGFNSVNVKAKEELSKKEIRKSITRDDLYKFGMLPELLGRFPLVSNLLPLEKEDLINILKLDTGIFAEYKTLFELQDKELIIDESIYDAIAEISMAENVGARGLRAIIESSLEDLMFNAPSEETKKYYIDSNYIKNNYQDKQMCLSEVVC